MLPDDGEKKSFMLYIQNTLIYNIFCHIMLYLQKQVSLQFLCV